VNFDAIQDVILKEDETDKVTVHSERKIKRKRAGGRIRIVTEPEDKTYRISFFKRRRFSDKYFLWGIYIEGRDRL
jgi:hypothetical protein